MKDGDFTCSDSLNYEFNRRKGTIESPRKQEGWAEQLNREPSVASGMQMLSSHHPEIFYTRGPTIQCMLRQKVGQNQTKLFTLDDFSRSASRRSTLKPRRRPCSSVAPALARRNSPSRTSIIINNPLVVKGYHAGVDGIIFDDMDFTTWTPLQTINLLSVELTGSTPASTLSVTHTAFPLARRV